MARFPIEIHNHDHRHHHQHRQWKPKWKLRDGELLFLILFHRVRALVTDCPLDT